MNFTFKPSRLTHLLTGHQSSSGEEMDREKKKEKAATTAGKGQAPPLKPAAKTLPTVTGQEEVISQQGLEVNDQRRGEVMSDGRYRGSRDIMASYL
jgi:hypothetical protein